MTTGDQHSESESLALARRYIGTRVRVVVDRPLGSAHPSAGFEYLLNYG